VIARMKQVFVSSEAGQSYVEAQNGEQLERVVGKCGETNIFEFVDLAILLPRSSRVPSPLPMRKLWCQMYGVLCRRGAGCEASWCSAL
jgi:hypothetical protein